MGDTVTARFALDRGFSDHVKREDYVFERGNFRSQMAGLSKFVPSLPPRSPRPCERPSRRLDDTRGPLLDCACFWMMFALTVRVEGYLLREIVPL